MSRDERRQSDNGNGRTNPPLSEPKRAVASGSIVRSVVEAVGSLFGGIAVFLLGAKLVAAIQSVKQRKSEPAPSADGQKTGNVAKERARESNKSTEGQLREELEKIVPLKNGGQITVKDGWAELDSLRILLDEHPQHFHTLLAIAQGREEGLDAASVAYLRSHAYVGGHLDQEVRDVLLSAYQETKEGPVLVNPFRLDDVGEASALEKVHEHDRVRFKREVWSRIRNDEQGRSP